MIKSEGHNPTIILYTKEPLIFVSAPLLLEASFDDLCDKVWIIDAADEVIIDRLMKRDGLSKEAAISALALRMSAQGLLELASSHQKEAIIIDNSTTPTDLQRQVQEILN